MECAICRAQGRESDLLPIYRRCPRCKLFFCDPHHSANPTPIPGVERKTIIVHWRDWGSVARKEEFKAYPFCLFCVASLKLQILSASEFILLQDDYLQCLPRA